MNDVLTPDQFPPLMNEAKAAQYLDVKPARLRKARLAPDHPSYIDMKIPYVRLSAKGIRYRKADLDAYIERNTVIPGKAA